jgi:uncharacterized protein (TIGR00369 family)
VGERGQPCGCCASGADSSNIASGSRANASGNATANIAVGTDSYARTNGSGLLSDGNVAVRSNAAAGGTAVNLLANAGATATAPPRIPTLPPRGGAGKSMSAEHDVVPDGYVPHLRASPVTDPWQPLFSRTDKGTVALALRVRNAHCNGKGLLHGGVINALADNAMGLSIIETLRQQGIERGRSGSTVSLSLDFLLTAQVGQWVEFVPRVLRVGRGIGFADCLVLADSQTIARGNATYRFYEEGKSGVEMESRST